MNSYLLSVEAETASNKELLGYLSKLEGISLLNIKDIATTTNKNPESSNGSPAFSDIKMFRPVPASMQKWTDSANYWRNSTPYLNYRKFRDIVIFKAKKDPKYDLPMPDVEATLSYNNLTIDQLSNSRGSIGLYLRLAEEKQNHNNQIDYSAERKAVKENSINEQMGLAQVHPYPVQYSKDLVTA